MADEDTTVEQQDLDAEATDEELSEEEQMMEELKKAVQVESEDVGTLRKRLSITVPRDLIDSRLSEQLTEKRREEIVPGFRRGRAPLKLIQKRFGKEIDAELSSRFVLSSYIAVTERDEIKTVGDPLLLATVPPPKGERGEPTEKLLEPYEAIAYIKLPDEGPLKYKCEIDIQPEFELPPLEGIEVTKAVAEVTDEQVNNEVKRLLAIRGHIAPVPEKEKIQEHDILIADLKVEAEGKEIAAEDNAQLAARDSVHEGIPLEGLGKAVIGKKAGAQVTLETKIPQEYAEADLRGKEATVDLTIHDVKRVVIPELDAAMLESMGFESEDELCKAIRDDLDAGAEYEAKRRMRDEIDAYLLEKTTLEIPAGISARMTDRAVANKVVEGLYQGIPEEEIKKGIDALKTSAAEEAARELKRNFIMERIAEDREILVTEDEVNGVIAEIARRQNMRFDRVRDELMKEDRLGALHVRLRDDKIRDALLADAKITEAPIKKKTAKKAGKKKKKKKSE